MNSLHNVWKRRVSRRGFLAGAGSGAVLAAAGCSGSSSTTTTPPTTPPTTTPTYTDADILNFALNLEYLEAEFYLRAATGNGLSAADALTGAGTVTGGAMVPGLTGEFAPLGYVLNEIAQDELNHVRAIQQAITGLGGTPVARPAIDFTDAFNSIATLLAVTPALTAFDPFSSPTNFLIGAFVFEDVGVTAYTGAAPLISSSAILSAAAGIQATEGYHAAVIRNAILTADAVAGTTSLTALANAVSTLRGSLGGGNETTLSQTGVIASQTGTGEAWSRTTDEVLHIVYAKDASGVSSGGFFPSGMNGTIKTTAS